MVMLMVMLEAVIVLPVVVLVTGIRAVGVRVSHHLRMTGEPCCSTSTTAPQVHLQLDRHPRLPPSARIVPITSGRHDVGPGGGEHDRVLTLPAVPLGLRERGGRLAEIMLIRIGDISTAEPVSRRVFRARDNPCAMRGSPPG
jgi:hypothetical protein